MKKHPIEKALVNFSLPDTISDPVIVRLKGSEIIGRIYQDFGNDNGAVTYTAINKDGEELCPPTDDWGTTENAFQKYAGELSEKSLAGEREKRWMEFADRYEEIQQIRENKNKKSIKHEITI